MFSIFPKLFRTNKQRVVKDGSTDNLDRPTVKKGYAHIFKGEKQRTTGVSPLSPNAHAIRMRGIG